MQHFIGSHIDRAFEGRDVVGPAKKLRTQYSALLRGAFDQGPPTEKNREFSTLASDGGLYV